MTRRWDDPPSDWREGPAAVAALLFGLLLAALVAICSQGCTTTPKRVVVDSAALTAVTLAGVARELTAADAALEVAAKLADAGDWSACARLAEPALLSRAKARPLADRLLWLAGLPYPDADDVQADPGLPPDPLDVSTVCGARPAALERAPRSLEFAP